MQGGLQRSKGAARRGCGPGSWGPPLQLTTSAGCSESTAAGAASRGVRCTWPSGRPVTISLPALAATPRQTRLAGGAGREELPGAVQRVVCLPLFHVSVNAHNAWQDGTGDGQRGHIYPGIPAPPPPLAAPAGRRRTRPPPQPCQSAPRRAHAPSQATPNLSHSPPAPKGSASTSACLQSQQGRDAVLGWLADRAGGAAGRNGSSILQPCCPFNRGRTHALPAVPLVRHDGAQPPQPGAGRALVVAIVIPVHLHKCRPSQHYLETSGPECAEPWAVDCEPALLPQNAGAVAHHHPSRLPARQQRLLAWRTCVWSPTSQHFCTTDASNRERCTTNSACPAMGGGTSTVKQVSCWEEGEATRTCEARQANWPTECAC